MKNLRNIFSFFTVHCSLFTLLILLCLPLLFLNVKDSHDWGDDFAQYLIQARNIIEHRPQTDNGLVFDEQTGDYALKAYHVGFPLMLAGVWKVSGASIQSFLILISFFTFLFAVLIFIYLSRFLKIPPLLSLLFVLAVMYNFIVLDLKKNILSDIPFSFFFLLSILSYWKLEERKFSWPMFMSVLTGILFGFTLSIRGIGIVLFIALGIKISWQIVVDRKEVMFPVSIFVVGFLTYVLLNSVFYPMSAGSFFEFYHRAFQGENITAMIHANAVYYYEVMKYFFNQGDGLWRHLSNITKYIMVYGLMAGILFTIYNLRFTIEEVFNRKSKIVNRKSHFDDMVFVLYFIVLFTYPYQAGGFRFWIPVIPFLLKYINSALTSILSFMRLQARYINFVMVALVAVVFLQNINGIENVIDTEKNMEDGPQRQSSAMMLDFVRNKLPADAVVAFVKPRALAFYSDKKVAYAVRSLSAQQNYEALRRMNVHYYLLSANDPQLNDQPLKKVIAAYSDKVKVIWQNDDFILYGDNTSLPQSLSYHQPD